MPTTYFLDTFAGSGTLSGRTSDNGKSYVDLGGGYTASNLLLDGSGNIYVNSLTTGGVYVSPNVAVPTAWDLTITATVNFTSGYLNRTFFAFCFDESNARRLYLDVGYSTSSGGFLYAFWSTTNIDFGVTGPNSLELAGTHTIRLLRGDGLDRLYLDGVLLGETSTVITDPASPKIGFYMFQSGNSVATPSISVSSIQFSSYAAPVVLPPTPDFWMSFVESYEVP